MIDFRYHLISLVAVFLALGLGILMGTVVLDDALVDSLDRDIKNLRAHNEDLEDEINEQDRRIDAANAFANEAVPWLTADSLEGRPIVVLQVEGTDADMVGAVTDAIVAAGGEVPTTIVITEKFGLQEQIARDQLALAIDSSASTAVDLRREAGTLLGSRMAAAAGAQATLGRPRDVPQQRLAETVQELQDTEFLSVVGAEEQGFVPTNAMFLILGGSADARTFDPTVLVGSLVTELSSGGAPTLVAEAAASSWGLVPAVREDPGSATRVSTVDQADTVEGRVAVVLGLARASEGFTDHYGVGPGATQVIPEPAPEP